MDIIDEHENIISKKSDIFYLNRCIEQYNFEEIVKLVNHNKSKYLSTLFNYKFLDQEDIRGRIPLIEASFYGYFKIVKYLIINGASVNNKNYQEKTALMYASSRGHFDTVKYLIKHNANINNINNEGTTALILAIHSNHINVIKYLIKRGANINKKLLYHKYLQKIIYKRLHL